MPRGKPSPKLAITVDADVHERVINAATAEGLSVSAWMTRAARRALLIGDGLAAVAEWEAEHGPLTDAEMAAARRARRLSSWRGAGAGAGAGAKALGVSVIYDAGALVGADRSERAVWADHRARLEMGLLPATTAPVVAQVSRSGRQAELRRFLRGCEIVPFGDDQAHDVGALAGRSGSADVVDVHVVAVAHRRRYGVLTSDENDLKPIADALRPRVAVFRV